MSWLKVLPCGPYATNAYLIGADDSDSAVLIDAPPMCSGPVGEALEAAGRRLEAVLITHPHFDHVLDLGAVGAGGVTVMAHPDAPDRVASPDTYGLLPPMPMEDSPARVDRLLADGDELELAGLSFLVRTVPGHDPASLAFHVPSENLAFVGDLIFRGGVGRTDLPGGSFDILAESIQTRIYSMDEGTVLYPGHGPSTTVGEEKRSNPFVRG